MNELLKDGYCTVEGCGNASAVGSAYCNPTGACYTVDECDGCGEYYRIVSYWNGVEDESLQLCAACSGLEG